MSVVAGELLRAKTQEADETWPETLEVVAYFGEKRTKRRSIIITSDQFFGRNGHGAPMTGDQLIRMIENLRIKRKT